jgi:hypothetical protein
MKIYQPNLPNTMEPYCGPGAWGMDRPSVGPEQTRIQGNYLEPRMDLGEKSVQGIELESVIIPEKKWYQSPIYYALLAVGAFYAAKKFKIIK